MFAVGASGAIFGLMGALSPPPTDSGSDRPGERCSPQLLLLLGINLALPLIVPNIAWEAHVGGLVAGIASSAAWDRPSDCGTGCNRTPGVGRSVSRHRGDGCGARRLIRAGTHMIGCLSTNS